MKNLVLITLILALAIPLTGEAQIIIDGEQRAYDFVRRTCFAPMDAFNEIYSEAALKNFEAAGRLWVIDKSGIEGIVGRRGIDGWSKFILESDSLHKALRDCFGNEQDLKDFYVMHIVAASTAGFYAGTVGGIGAPLKVLQWGLQFAKRMGGAAAMRTMVQKGWIEQSTAAHIGMVAGGSVIVGMAAPPLIEANEARLENNRRMRADFDKYLKDFNSYVAERATLTQSARDQAYSIELNDEIKAVGKLLLSNPAGTKSEYEDIKAKIPNPDDWKR